MMVTPLNVTIANPSTPDDNIITPTTPFFVVADSYTVGQIREIMNGSAPCTSMNISDPIPFNSTGNLQLGSVVQYYRGDSAAVLLRGYENAKESPSSPNLVPNPPFPQDASLAGWNCINKTIGESIPLMYSGSSHTVGKIVGSVVGVLGGGFILLCLILICLIRMDIIKPPTRGRDGKR